MSQTLPQASPPQQITSVDRIRLSCVDWKEYSRFLYLFADARVIDSLTTVENWRSCRLFSSTRMKGIYCVSW